MNRVRIILLVWIVYCSCTSTSQLAIPFSVDAYQSSSAYLRTVSHGESESENVAERMAIHTAQIELTSFIQTLIKNVSTEFNSAFQSAELDGWNTYFQKEEMSIAQQTMTQLRVVEKKVILRSDQRYEIWVIVELPKKDFVDGFERIFSASKASSLEEKKNRFRQVFDREWAKLVQ